MRFVDDTVKFVEKRPGTALGVAAVMQFLGFGLFARLAIVGVGAVWLIDQVREIEMDRASGRRGDQVDQDSEDSFPASDAPSTSPSMAGNPEETDG